MKILMYILIGLAALALGWQVYVWYQTSKTEKQNYTKVKSFDELEIRHYPEAIMATVEMDGKDANRGFGTLASYIFGSNEKETKIAMTSPVHMQKGESTSKMSFVMPSKWQLDSLPRPKNSSIEIHKTEPTYAAVITFGGFGDKNKVEKKKEQLRNLLDKHGFEASGKMAYLAYNPPYQLIGRRNEIWVPIQYEGTGDES